MAEAPGVTAPGPTAPRPAALRRAAVPCLVIATVLGAAAAAQGRLDAGAALFLGSRRCVVDGTRRLCGRLRGSRGGSTVAPAERALVQLVGIAMLWLPSLAIATPLIDVADYPPRASLILCGLAFGPSGVWLFWRSHADLGRNWSPVLELRDGHRLVTGGVYARLRHPMYAAILLLTCVQAALVSNWIAGPAGACAVLILLACRLDEEEAMMASRFGEDWHAYVARTGALFPIPDKGAPDA